MISYFSMPYQDELLYSVIARFINHSKMSIQEINETIYNSTGKIYPITDLPNRIGIILENTPLKFYYSPEELVKNNTLFPFYSMGISNQRKKELLHRMISDQSIRSYEKIGLYFNSIAKSKYLKFCPLCIKDDVERYGEPYWHVTHQLPGVTICIKHKVYLQDSCRICGHRFETKKWIFAALGVRCELGHDLKIQALTKIEDDLDFIKKYNYAEFANKVLAGERLLDPANIINNLKIRLKNQGKTKSNGYILRKKLARDFITYYGHSFLDEMESSVDIDHVRNWLFLMFVKNRTRNIHPVRLILLAMFVLESNFDSDIQIPFEPFGSGPWACLNSNSDHFRELTINSCQLGRDSDTGFVYGRMKCECGLQYYVSGPCMNDVRDVGISNIPNIRDDWARSVVYLRRTTKLPLRSLVKYLGGSLAVINRIIRSSGLNISRSAKIRKKSKDLMERYRNRLISLIRDNMTRKELSKLAPKEYDYLMRNDREWLDNILSINKIKGRRFVAK
jgi:hypothetical protein